MRDLPVGVVLNSPTSTGVNCSIGGDRTGTVKTTLFSRARSLLRISSKIVLTRFFRDTLLVSELVNTNGLTTVAAATSLTIEDDLNTQGNIRPSSVSSNVDSISKGGGSTMSPARTTVLRNVLVSGERKIVDIADISPIPVLRKSGSIEIFVRKRTSHNLSGVLIGFTNAGRSRMEIVGLVQRFVRANLGRVSDIISPGVQRNSPVATLFNVKHINTSQLSVETLFTPVRSPRISDDPVIGSVSFLTPTNNGDNVISSRISSSIIVNTTSVVVSQIFSGIDVTSNRTSVVDFLHHILFTSNITVFGDSVNLSVFLSPTSLSRHAVLAHNLSRTAETVVVTVGLVRRTRFISDIVFLNPLESGTRVTTVTTVGVIIARN